ncbi:MAG: HigA family addiction module antidote protein [Mesorhizobium sp.]|uniref:HigA family addiction module antitoxin n=1 Tax=Mesorhizobium sp. TaxID=1871066 RepID=UPI001AC5A465|nr:HigA family addiction module antitoxin [Mesorhizobium sp.]MBN9223041.1 HigA family addiction module antidote protein [Mesorhizobium sp.]
MDAVFDNFAEPPGVYIKEELEARNWSQRDLAYILGYTEQTVNKIITGKQGVTAEMAKALGQAFGTSADVWANLQNAYELRLAREPDPAIKARAQLQSAFPIREMIRRGWFAETDQTLLELQVTRFFEVGALADVPKLSFAGAAKRPAYDDEPAEQIAWLYRVRQIARTIDVPRYAESALRAALPRLRSLVIDPEDARYLPAILHECGVRFVVVETLPSGQKEKIDGVCTWLDDESPVIGISTFHDRFDNFWFVVRHEIEHVLRGHGKKKSILDNFDETNAMSDGNDIEKEEQDANAAALSFCFPREKLKAFYARKSPFISERDMIGFSALMEVHPAIVVGQIQYLKNDYRWLRKYLPKIRSHLLETAVSDGWGHVAEASL